MADDFFLMVHDDVPGRSRLSDRILGLGLAGALLGELAILGAIGIDDGSVKLTGHALPPDPLAADVYGDLMDEQPRPVRDWLNYLAQQAPERVAKRLESENLVYFKAPRVRLPGIAGRWTPTDITTAGWPAIDVKLKVHNGHADVHHLMLFGLTRATGLNHPSLWEVRELLQDPAVLQQTLAPLRSSPPLLELLAQTEAAVGSAVTSQRIT
ncbi:GPP34 family phosphoprotein [Catenulispora subtropica]|uniref:GPP34 family phosphoprotein n=1 Tax=Catenulispora subtropica TaxID=450798 RepID=UPI0031E2DCBE